MRNDLVRRGGSQVSGYSCVSVCRFGTENDQTGVLLFGYLEDLRAALAELHEILRCILQFGV